MTLRRRNVLGAAVAMGVFAAGAPIADAQIMPFPFVGPTNVIGQANAPALCAANSPAGNGFAGGTTSNGCWSGAAGVGPAIGEMANVTGPVVTGSALLAPIVVSAGSTLGGD